MVLKIPSGLFGQNDVREIEGLRVTTQTRYLSISPADIRGNSELDDWDYSGQGSQLLVDTAGSDWFIPIKLPHGAVITGCVIYGNAGATGDDWYLKRTAINAGSMSTMATAKIGTEDTTITNATVDNSAYAYFIMCDAMDATDQIYGGRITYTTGVIEV